MTDLDKRLIDIQKDLNKQLRKKAVVKPKMVCIECKTEFYIDNAYIMFGACPNCGSKIRKWSDTRDDIVINFDTEEAKLYFGIKEETNENCQS